MSKNLEVKTKGFIFASTICYESFVSLPVLLIINIKGGFSMKITIQSIKFDATEKLTEYTEKKVGKLERFIDAETAEVVFKVTKPQTANNKEVTLKIGGLHAEKVADTFEEAIDGVVDAIKTQIEKKKNKV